MILPVSNLFSSYFRYPISIRGSVSLIVSLLRSFSLPVVYYPLFALDSRYGRHYSEKSSVLLLLLDLFLINLYTSFSVCTNHDVNKSVLYQSSFPVSLTFSKTVTLNPSGLTGDFSDRSGSLPSVQLLFL